MSYSPTCAERPHRVVISIVSEQQQCVVAALGGGPLSAHRISGQTGLSRVALDTILVELRELGLVRRRERSPEPPAWELIASN